jgi:hypothetical protein
MFINAMISNAPCEFSDNIWKVICQKIQSVDTFIANKCQSIDIFVHLHINQRYGKFSLLVL